MIIISYFTNSLFMSLAPDNFAIDLFNNKKSDIIIISLPAIITSRRMSSLFITPDLEAVQ